MNEMELLVLRMNGRAKRGQACYNELGNEETTLFNSEVTRTLQSELLLNENETRVLTIQRVIRRYECIVTSSEWRMSMLQHLTITNRFAVQRLVVNKIVNCQVIERYTEYRNVYRRNVKPDRVLGVMLEERETSYVTFIQLNGINDGMKI